MIAGPYFNINALFWLIYGTKGFLAYTSSIFFCTSAIFCTKPASIKFSVLVLFFFFFAMLYNLKGDLKSEKTKP